MGMDKVRFFNTIVVNKFKYSNFNISPIPLIASTRIEVTQTFQYRLLTSRISKSAFAHGRPYLVGPHEQEMRPGASDSKALCPHTPLYFRIFFNSQTLATLPQHTPQS